MIKLLGHTLTQETRFRPEGMKVDLTERTSTAGFTAKLGEMELQRDDWLMDNEEPCAGIVWRVKGTDETYDGETTSVELEHVINTLKDTSMFGDITAKMISGTTNCTAKQAAQYILSKQNIWVLGDFEFNLSAPFEFNGETLFDALEIVTSALDDPVWEYDMTSLPFVLHIRHGATEPECEMRMGRNIAKLKKRTDWQKTFTRIYPIGKNNLKLPEEYISRNEEIYGRIDKIQTDQSQGTVEMLRIWATDWLKRHCEPKITITISGLDLSRATGEPMDRLVINRKCRVPLPKYATTISERIAKLSWKDKLKEPENVQVTLCNELDDITTIINKMSGGGGRGGRADAKDREEDHAWFVDTESHVAMVAEAIIGRDPQMGVDWSRVAEIIVDGSGIHQKVLRAEGSITTAFGRMDMNEESLTTIFQKTGVDSLSSGQTLYGMQVMSAESLQTVFTKTGVDSLQAGQTLYGMQQLNAESLTTVFQKTGVDSLQAGETLYSRETRTAESFQSLYEKTGAADIPAGTTVWSQVQQNANKVGMVVGTRQGTDYIKAGEICLAINNDGSSTATINASKVMIGNQDAETVINGKVTMDQVTAKIAEFGFLTVGSLATKSISVQSMNATGGIAAGGAMTAASMECTGQLQADTMKLGGHTMLSSGILYGQPTKTESGGNITLTFPTCSGGSYSVTFSKAASVTLNGSWSGNMFTVEETRTGQKIEETLTESKGSTWGTTSITDFDANHKMTIYVTGTRVGTGGGRLFQWNIDATGQYDAGVTAGKAAIGITGAWSGNQFVASLSGKTGSVRSSAVKASAGIAYNSTTHKYTATGYAYADDISGYFATGTATSGTEAWDGGRSDGWSGCYNGIQLSQTTEKTLDVNGSITIYAQAFQTPNATVRSNKASVKINAPSMTKYSKETHSGTNRGGKSSIQEIGNAVHFKRHTSSQTPTGTWYEINSSSYDLTYYLAKSAVDYYASGSGYTYYTHNNNTDGDLYKLN